MAYLEAVFSEFEFRVEAGEISLMVERILKVFKVQGPERWHRK